MDAPTIPAHPAPSRGPGLLAACIVFNAMSLMFVMARIARCAKVRKFLLEDSLILIAMLCSTAVTVIFGIAYASGSGKHIWQIKQQDLPTLEFVNWLSDPVACYAFMTSKLSVGIVMLRLGFDRTFQGIVIFTMLVAILFNIWPSTAQFVGCNAWKYQTDPAAAMNCVRGSELSLVQLLYIQSGGNIAVDFIYVLLLEIYIRRIKLSSRDRFAIRIVLVFMLAATICCIVKTTMFNSIATSTDITYDVIPIAVLSVAEIHLAVSAACLPAVRLLLGRYFPRRLRFWKTSRGTDYYAEEITSHTKIGTGTMASRTCKTEGTVRADEDTDVLRGPSATEMNVWISKGGKFEGDDGAIYAGPTGPSLGTVTEINGNDRGRKLSVFDAENHC